MANSNNIENSETDNTNISEDSSKQKKFYQKIGDYLTEKKDDLIEKIDIVQYAKTELEQLIVSKFPLMTANVRQEIETFVDSKVPIITAKIREETEKLIEHKLNDLYAFIRKIAILLFVLTLPLTIGVWAIALAIYFK